MFVTFIAHSKLCTSIISPVLVDDDKPFVPASPFRPLVSSLRFTCASAVSKQHNTIVSRLASSSKSSSAAPNSPPYRFPGNNSNTFFESLASSTHPLHNSCIPTKSLFDATDINAYNTECTCS